MAGIKTLIDQDEGVELWRTDLHADGMIAATAYYLTSLRTPERPGFGSEAEAREAFAAEVAASVESDLVQQRLRR